MEFVYDLTVDPDAENNTHAFSLAMIGHNKRVLEVGCATGYFTKVLAECGCKVVGMELDPEAALVAEESTSASSSGTWMTLACGRPSTTSRSTSSRSATCSNTYVIRWPCSGRRCAS